MVLLEPQSKTAEVVRSRCSHSWPTGVDPVLFVKNVMPKLDSAASGHIVWSEKFPDNYVPLGEKLTATWGCSVKTARAIGKGTLVLSTWLPDGSRSPLVLNDVPHIPALRVNLISVSKMLSVADSKEVFFSGGAKVLQQGVLVGYSPDTRDNNDLYPLLCTIASGSVRGGEAHPLGLLSKDDACYWLGHLGSFYMAT